MTVFKFGSAFWGLRGGCSSPPLLECLFYLRRAGEVFRRCRHYFWRCYCLIIACKPDGQTDNYETEGRWCNILSILIRFQRIAIGLNTIPYLSAPLSTAIVDSCYRLLDINALDMISLTVNYWWEQTLVHHWSTLDCFLLSCMAIGSDQRSRISHQWRDVDVQLSTSLQTRDELTSPLAKNFD